MLIILVSGIDINLLLVYKKHHIYKQILLLSIISILLFALLYLVLIILPDNFLVIGYAAPLGLLVGPFIIFFKSVSIHDEKKNYLNYVHLAPFLISFIFYILFLIKNLYFRNTSNNYEYFLVLYLISAISWLSYSLWMVCKQFSRKISYGFVEIGYFLPDATSYVVLLLASVYNIAIILTRNNDISLIIRTYNFSFLFLLLWFLLIFHYVITNILSLCIHYPIDLKNKTENKTDTQSNQLDVDNIDLKYEKSQLSTKQITEYKKKIEEYLSKEPYLNSDFSLEIMSADLKIYKHHCSQFFNKVYGINFSKYINRLRIEKACSFIEKEDNLTIEEIATMCGFNSRASFYRNFNSIMGCNTSEYKQRIIESKKPE